MKLCEEKEKIEVEIEVIQSGSGIKRETYFATKHWKAWIHYSDEFNYSSVSGAFRLERLICSAIDNRFLFEELICI